MTIFYTDVNGNYIGGFDGQTGKVPAGAIPVSLPPQDAAAKWDGKKWVEPVPTKDEKIEVVLVAQGLSLEDRVAALEKKVYQNDSTSADAIQATKDSVK